MTQPNRSSALLPLLGLAAGLAIGFGIARSLPDREPSKIEASASRQAALTPKESATIAEPETPLSPQEESSGDERVAVAPVTAPTGGGQSPPVRRKIDATLRNELSAYLNSGQFEEQMINDGESIQEFLAYEYAKSDQPQLALDLLERFPTRDPDIYMTVGARLMLTGDQAAASTAYLKAFELQPFSDDILDELKEVDPAGALAAVEARAAELGAEAPPILNLQRAQLLAGLGRTEEALAIAQSLVGFNNSDTWAMELMADLDPEGVERELRSRLGNDPQGLIATQLAGKLMESERPEEAVRLLEDALAKSPQNLTALRNLALLKPEAILSYLDSPVADELDSGSLSYAGSMLFKSGREADGIDLWVRVMDQDLDDEEAIEGLLMHAPGRLWEKCNQIAQESSDDEAIGDVADLYWEQGRKEEAAELWRRASLIDPSDSEWSGNLRSLLLGEDPI